MYIKKGVTIESKDGGYLISMVYRGYRWSEFYLYYTKRDAYRHFVGLTD